MTAETELWHVTEDEIVQRMEEVQSQQREHDIKQLGHGAHIASMTSTETTPLVLKAAGDVVIEFDDAVDYMTVEKLDDQKHENEHADDLMSTHEIVREEAWGVFRLAIPITGSQTLEVLPSTLFDILLANVAGDKAATIIAASGLFGFYQSLVVSNLVGGFGTALETVCAQSFGAKQFVQLCLYAQAGLLAVAYSIPILALLNLNGATVFKFLGQDPTLSELAAVFTSLSVLSLPFVALYVVAKYVLMSQHIAAPFAIIPVAANAIALPLAYVLGNYTGLGYIGVVLGSALADVLKFAMVVPLCYKSPAFSKAVWPGFQWREAHQLLWRLVPLGFSSVLMVTFQALGFNMSPLLSGYLPNAEQSMASNNIAAGLFALVVVPSVGAFASGSIRVGTALGGGRTRRAAIAGTIGAVMTTTVAIISALISVLVAGSFMGTYTQDKITVEAATTLYYHLLPCIPLLGWMLGVQGVLRACGKQWLIASLSFLFMFVIGVPTGLVLGITFEFGVQGLWYGQMIGLMGCSTVLTWIVYHLDWHGVAEEAYQNTHVHVEHEPLSGPHG